MATEKSPSSSNRSGRPSGSTVRPSESLVAKAGTKRPRANPVVSQRFDSTRGDDRHRQIAERAYYKAQARGFTPGSELQDWLEAESEIDSAGT